MSGDGRRNNIDMTTQPQQQQQQQAPLQEMDPAYPDSVGSSPRSSRDTDSDFHRWDGASGEGGSSRVRLMCSFGGKIVPRPHDNQLAYVGGDTRILAVDRNIRFSAMMAKLSVLWGSNVSFKYQLPNEDLDALVSVTNDEDLDNMMAEYDRLCKMGYRFSRLRLFLFRGGDGNGSAGGGSTGSLGSLLEDPTKKESWFVDALNAAPQQMGSNNRSDSVATGSEASWSNALPDYLFGLEGKQTDDADPNEGSVRSVSSRTESNKPDQYIPKTESYDTSFQPPTPPTLQSTQPVQEFQRMQIREQTEPPKKVYTQETPSPVYTTATSEYVVETALPTPAPSVPVPAPSVPIPVPAQSVPVQGTPNAPSSYMQQAQPVTYWQVPDPHQQVYVMHGGGGAMLQRPPPSGYYTARPPPTVTQPGIPLVYSNDPAQPAVSAVRTAPMMQRQSNPSPDEYRDQGMKIPMYAPGPPPPGMMYKQAAPPQQAFHHEGVPYSYQSVVYETGGARPVYYTQAPPAAVLSSVPVMGNPTNPPQYTISAAAAAAAELPPRVTQSS